MEDEEALDRSPEGPKIDPQFANDVFAEIEKTKKPGLKKMASQQKWYTPGELPNGCPLLTNSYTKNFKHKPRPMALESHFRIQRNFLPGWKFGSDTNLKHSLGYKYDHARKTECCFHPKERERNPLYNPAIVKQSSNVDEYNLLNNFDLSPEDKKIADESEYALMKEIPKKFSSRQKQEVFDRVYQIRLSQKNNILNSGSRM
jgi:hypothetical protein